MTDDASADCKKIIRQISSCSGIKPKYERLIGLCHRYDIGLFSYRKADSLFLLLNLQNLSLNVDGFAVRIMGHDMIFYNEKAMPERQLYTIAHEMGHIVYGHTSADCDEDQIMREQKADMFARDCLMT